MSIGGIVRSTIAGAAMRFSAWLQPYSEITRPSADRENIFYYLPSDSRFYLDTWTRREILRKVDWLYQTFGLVKEAIRGTARHTVGKGICLSVNSDDEDFNAAAEADFDLWALAPARCDRSGRRNFYEIQTHAVRQRLKQGEFFAAFVPNPRWDNEPCLRLYDAMEIESAPDEINEYNIDGVKLDHDHNPIAFTVRSGEESHSDIPAANMVHWFDGDQTNQVRGVSDFAQAVVPLVDARELIKLVTKTAKQNSAIGLHIKKLVKAGGRGALDKIRSHIQAGGPPNGQPGQAAQPNPDHPKYERLTGGGAIIYTDEDGDVKFLTPNSPSPLVEPFINKVLIRDAACSWGVPQEFFWEVGHINSSSSRFILMRADALFSTLGDGLVGRLCQPAAVRYLQHRIEIGALAEPRDPKWMNKLSWQLPMRVTIDNGRDGALEINQLANGIENLATINDRRGRNWRQITEQWFREMAYASKQAKKHGVDWALALWRPNTPGAKGGEANPNDLEEKLEDAQPGSSQGDK